MTNLPPVSQLASEMREMKSDYTGKHYLISIALPYSYTEDPLEFDLFDKSLTVWPVVYLLDANWWFGLATDIVRATAIGGRATDAIIVGIGYPEDKSPQQTWRNVYVWREDDLSPTRSEPLEKEYSEWVKRTVKTGGAGQFLTFLKRELIPMIDQEYRTDPSKRTLLGHSLAGLFTTFALFQEPGLFSRYIAASPALWFDNKFIFDFESAFADKHKELNAQFYLAVGELEEDVGSTMVTDTYRFAAQLDARRHKGFSLTRQVFSDKNHAEIVGPAFQAGLRMALAK